MKEKYKQVVDQFYKECLIRRISDEWLKKHDKDTRSSCEMTGEFRYGIVYLRDDAVEVLLDYIKELGGDI